MIQLLKNFSWEQIILFAVLLALAIKGCVSFFDWVSERNKKVHKQYQKPIEFQNNLQEHDEQIAKIQEQIQSLTDMVNLLIESDRDDIKAFITREYHYFCYQKGWIDDYSLDCIEKRYTHYQAEGGNSFVSTMMEDLRDLPRREPDKQGGQ